MHARISAYLAVLLLWTCLSLCSAAYEQKNITDAPGYILPQGLSIPQPLTVAPDQSWAGIDGQWNTFTLRIGSQQAVTQVLPSTASQQIWVVNSEACDEPYLDPSANETTLRNYYKDCQRTRGYAFDNSTSRTWESQGFYELWVGGTYGLTGVGYFGFDSVVMGLPGEEGPTVANTTIGTIKTTNFWLGHLGLHPKSTNFSANLLEIPPVPSYMTRLFEQGSIPSISFGYTTGVQYYDATYLGSLTLGGYDSSRFISNNASFVFSPDNERDLVVGLAGLTAKTTTQSDINLLPDGTDDVTLSIDTTVAELWLPLEICQAFEEALGLTYDNATQLYLVDDVLHQTLQAQDPSVTFTLHQSHSTNETVQITLPYAAFDLEAQYPYRGLREKTRYFPLRRASDKGQFTLGRMFLQEAYLVVDWDRARFSVYQCDWTYGQPSNIVPIVAAGYLDMPDTRIKGDSHTGMKVGISVGCVFLVALIASAVGGYYWRRRRSALTAQRAAEVAEMEAARKASPTDTDETPCSPVSERAKGPNVFPKAELPCESNVHRYEMGAEGKEKQSVEILEVENSERAVFEMLGDIPAPQEAAGRQLSEKETMMVRERNINGTDPQGVPPVSPVGRRAPIASLDEVAMVSGRLPSGRLPVAGDGVSPVTPRAPRDGAFLEAGDTFFQAPGYRGQREGRAGDETECPMSPVDAGSSMDTSRRRFSYES